MTTPDPTIMTASGGLASSFGAPGISLVPPKANVCNGGTVPTIPTNDTADLTSYNSKVSYHKRAQDGLNLIGGHVALIGDSILEGFPHQLISPFAQNYGIGGDTTSGVLNRLSGYTALGTARAVVLMIGVNDVSTAVATATIESRINSIIDWLTGPLVFCNILPTSTSAWNTTIDTINAASATHITGTGRTNIQTVNVKTALLNGGSILSPLYSSDGIHPNGTAQTTIIAPAIRTALGLV